MILPIKQNCNHLAIVGDGHEYYARGRDNLQMPTHRLTFFLKNKPTITGINLYNNQPQEIKKKVEPTIILDYLKQYILYRPIF